MAIEGREKRALRRKQAKPKPEPSCSFCGKTRSEVKTLVSGPDVSICDECVGLCVEIIAESAAENG